MSHTGNRIGLALICLASIIPAGAQTHDHAAMTVTDGEFNPYVVSDNRGGFYVSYIERKNGVSNVMLEHSQPSGGSAPPLRINNRPGDGAVRNENPPKIAIGPNGQVYAVWASAGTITYSVEGGQNRFVLAPGASLEVVS